MKVKFELDNTNPHDLALAYKLNASFNRMLPCVIGDVRFDLITTFYTERATVSTGWSIKPDILIEAHAQSVTLITLDPKVVAAEESVKKAKEALKAAEDALSKVKGK